MAANSTKKILDVWQRFTNPLRSLTQPEIERMMENARFGNDARLQIAFDQIEKTFPILQICLKKRQSAVFSREWDITPIGTDAVAKTQAENLKKMLLECDQLNEDGLTAALNHLSLAVFRGRSAIKPFIIDGRLHLKKLQNWHIFQKNNAFYWNPQILDQCILNETIDLQKIPENEIACIVEDLPVDFAAISIFLRSLIAEETWARFVEKSGIPQVLLSMPKDVPDSEVEKWNWRAKAIFEGASGVLPGDTVVNQLTAARAQDPFSEFVKHQMEMIAILAVGSPTIVLGGSTGLGSDLTSQQEKAFQTLINLDCKKIANAMTACVLQKCADFLNQKLLCRFEFVEDDIVAPEKYLEMANVAKQMGLTIDIPELKRLTKLSFIKETESEIWAPSEGEAK